MMTCNDKRHSSLTRARLQTDLSGDGVENFSVFENDQSGHVRDYLSFSELFAHVDLDVWQPHLRHEVGGAHEAPVGAPVRGRLVDDYP